MNWNYSLRRQCRIGKAGAGYCDSGLFHAEVERSEAAVLILARLPDTGIVILTMDDSEQVINDVLQAGVSSLVLKSDADRDLLVAVASVAENRPLFAGRVAKVILAGYLARNSESTTKVKSPVTDLTEREREVMRLLTEGMSSKKAAMQMQISIRTVESHRININRKLGFNSIADLVRYAVRNGIVTHT